MSQASSPSSSSPKRLKAKPGEMILAIPGHNVALTREQAALRIGCDIDFVSRLIDEGRIRRHWRIGQYVMVWLSDVDDCINNVTEHHNPILSFNQRKRAARQPKLVQPVAAIVAGASSQSQLTPPKITAKSTRVNAKLTEGF